MIQIAFFLIAVALQNPVSLGTRGLVVTVSHDPLSDASVLGMPTGESVKTNARGEFVLSESSDFVRFSASGFRPITKSRDEVMIGSPIVMERDPLAIWAPGICPPVQTQNTLNGDSMGFVLTLGTKYSTEIGDDYQTKMVCEGKYCMQLGWGALWSFGFPPRGFLKDLTITKERDIQYRPEVGLQGVEYRGTRGDGAMTRWVGKFNETISYENVPASVAESFDRIIDSLCWSRKR